MSTKTAEQILVNGSHTNGHAPVATPVVVPADSGVTAEDVKTMLTAQLEAAHKQAMLEAQSNVAIEIAEPEGFLAWDVFGLGPVELGAGVFPFSGPPYLPNQVIRVGDTALVATILVFGPGFTSFITPFAVPYQISYSTGDLKSWTLAEAALQGTNSGNLIPNLPFVVDVFEFTPTRAGLYEMNICAQILDATGGTAPPFAGFARSISKIEPLLFQPQPNVMIDTGIKFQVYEN